MSYSESIKNLYNSMLILRKSSPKFIPQDPEHIDIIYLIYVILLFLILNFDKIYFHKGNNLKNKKNKL